MKNETSFWRPFQDSLDKFTIFGECDLIIGVSGGRAGALHRKTIPSLINPVCMFLGHYGVAFAAKKAAPKVSLAWLFAAAQFADILWPLLLVTHVEEYALQPGYSKVSAYNFISYPWSHSLLMDLVWAVLTGFLYSAFTRDRQGGFTIGLVVLSHWFLDLVVHVPDLPLSPFTSVKAGLSGWNSLTATLIVELSCFLGGLAIYFSSTRPLRAAGSWLLWVLVLILMALFFMTTFTKPRQEPLMTMFVSFMVLLGVIFFIAWLVDKNRRSVAKNESD